MPAVLAESFFILADLFPEALVLVASDGTLIKINQAGRLVLGLDAEQFDQRSLIDFVVDPPEKLLGFLRLCARSRSMIPGVFTWRYPANGQNRDFYVEGGVVQPAVTDTAPILLLRWRPHRQAIRKFVELNEQIQQLSKEMFFRQQAAEELTRLYEAEQQARQAVEQMARRVASLQVITAALSGAITPSQVARVIIEEGLPVLGAAGGVVTSLNEARTELEILYYDGSLPSIMIEGGQRLPMNISSPLTQAAQSGEPLFIESMAGVIERYPGLEQFCIPGSQACVALPLSLKERTIGAISLGFAEPRIFGEKEQEYMLILAQQCAQALERARLYEVEQQARLEAEANQERMALLAKMQERHRLAQDLHDTVAQALGYLNLKAGMTYTSLTSGHLDTAKANLQELKQIISETYTDVREEIFHLRAQAHSNLSFMELLNRYIDKYRRFYDLDIQLIQEADPALFEFTAEVTSQLIRTVQESLINVRKHARVNTAVIRLGQEKNGAIRISIEDQGQGFDPEKTKGNSASFGLQIMRERMESVGGSVELHTTPGQGAQVILRYSV